MVTLDQAGWGRAALILLPPPLALVDLVDFLWIDQRPRARSAGDRWRVVPDDAPHIIYCRFTDERRLAEQHRLHVVGARERYVDIDRARRVLTVGARLRPGALPVLFDVSARELTDRSEPADSLVRNPSRAALSRLEDAAPSDAAQHITAFIDSLARGRTLDARARWLAGTDGAAVPVVRDAAKRLGVGERALRAWSTAQFGLGLRRFMTIRRLHRALEGRLRHPTTTWSRIAAWAGFADQPHLVRDCRALLGETPREFLARAS